jgi:hypothetical protein
VRHRRVADAEFEENDQAAENETEQRVEEGSEGERLQLMRRIPDRRYEQDPCDHKPGHEETPRGMNPDELTGDE